MATSSTLDAADPEPAKPNWAIVATDGSLSPVADLLTARLSRWSEIALVERAEVPRVLAELKLNASGLVQPDQAVRFGELVHADALLLLEPIEEKPIPGRPAPAAGQQLRLRLAEVKTGVRMIDAVLQRKGTEAELDLLEAELKRARTKSAIPLDKRRYVGVVPFKSEESGDALKPLGRTLAALVAVDLQRRESIIVVERDQLHRLANEKSLTGVELKLRGSSQLIEAGLRRDGKRLIIACRINALGGSDVRKAEVTTETADVPVVLPELLKALDTALDAAPAKTAFDPKAEAAVLAKRRDQFRSARRHGEEAELAEVVFALDPSQENLTALFRAYSGVVQAFQPGALEAKRRHGELRLERLRRLVEDGSNPDGVDGSVYSYNIFDPHVRIRVTKETDEDRRIRAEADRLNLEAYEAAMKLAAKDPASRRRLLHERIRYAAYLAETGADFSRDFPRLLDEMFAALKDIEAPLDLSDRGGQGPYPEFIREMMMQVGKSVQNCQRSSRGEDQRDWVVEDVIGLWRQLARHEHPLVRMAGCAALCSRLDAEGREAALKVLAISREWPAGSVPWVESSGDNAVFQALMRLNRTGDKEEQEFMDGVLTRAEKGDRAELLRLTFTTMTWVSRAPKDAMPARAGRVLAILKSDLLTSAEAQRLAGVRQSMETLLKNAGGVNAPVPAPAEFSFADAPGLWRDFRARPLKLRPPQSALRGPSQLHAVFAVPDAVKDDELYLVFSAPGESFAVERRRLGESASRPFGSPVKAGYDGFQGIPFAIAGDTFYIGSSKPHIGIVRKETVDYLDESRGLPTKRVTQLAWLKERLYVAYPGGLAEYHPDQATFRTLASATAVERKSPLDGGGFMINSLIADSSTDSLWMTVYGAVEGKAKSGLWRYEPASDSWESFDWTWYDMSRWGDVLISFHEVPVPGRIKRARRWRMFDMKEKKPLDSRYAPWVHTRNPSFSRIDRYIKLGENLITSDGQLLTPDGQIHRMPNKQEWHVLTRVGDGFVTHYDAPGGTLWYVEPKTPQNDEEPEPDASK